MEPKPSEPEPKHSEPEPRNPGPKEDEPSPDISESNASTLQDTQLIAGNLMLKVVENQLLDIFYCVPLLQV